MQLRGAALLIGSALALAAPPASAAISFRPAQSYPATLGGSGGAGGTIVAGNFNSDGRPDLAVVDPGASGVSLLPGKGDGSFGARVTTPTGAGAYTVAGGDFNSDGRTDLAVASDPLGGLTVLLGRGDLRFSIAGRYATGLAPQQIAVADLNRDGHLDLGVANAFPGDVSVFLGRGDGHFEAAPRAPAGVPGAASVVATDLNGDGAPDLALVGSDSSSPSGKLAVLIAKGDGRFAAPAAYKIGFGAESVAAGDLNGDGNTDLVAATFLTNDVWVSLGQGAGRFSSPRPYDGGSAPLGVVIADFDLDQKPDLALANDGTGSVKLLRGTGMGTFTPAGDHRVVSAPQTPVDADLNGDGLRDLALAGSAPVGGGSKVSILLNASPMSALSRRCLARRSPIGRRSIGRVRLGYSRARLLRLPISPVRRTRHAYRYCVARSRGSVNAVFGGRGRVALVTTTARGHGNRGVRVRSRAETFRRAYPHRTRMGRGLYRAYRRSSLVVGLRRGRVRFIAVVDRRLLRSARLLRRSLGWAGL